MTANLIDSIGALWPLVGILCATFVLWLFRDAIRQRGFTLRHRDTSVALPPEQGRPRTLGEDEAEGEPPAEEALASSEGLEEDEDEMTPEDEMVSAAVAGDLESARAAFAEVQSHEIDPAKRRENEVRFAFLRAAYTTDPAAFADLQRHAEDEDLKPMALQFIAFVYEQSGDDEKARAAFEEAAALESDPGRRVTASAASARARARLGDVAGAVAYISEQLAGARAPDERHVFYRALAEIYRDRGDFGLRAIALDLGAELRPNDPSVRFEAGYSFSQAALEHLSLHEYKLAVRYNPEHTSAHNNLGVAYERLAMPMRSVAEYKAAADLGLTLAMANLAYRQMNAGFGHEADETLANAREFEEVHPNVGSALAALSERRTSEQDLERDRLRDADVHARFLRRFGHAYFEAAKPPELAGQWQIADGQVESVEAKEGLFDIVWQPSGSGRRRALGQVLNRGMTLTFFQQRYDVGKTPAVLRWFESGSGYGVITGDASVEMIRFENGAAESLAFSRQAA